MTSQKKFTITDEDLDKLLKLFQNFSIDNIWSGVTSTKEFTARRFQLGFVNDICCCEMTKEAHERLLKTNLYRVTYPALVVKFLASEMWMEIDRLELAVVNAIVSQNGISPELVFVNKECVVNQYVKGRCYTYEDDCDTKMVQKLARLLAKVHSLGPVPISNGGYQRWIEMTKNPEENEWGKQFCIDKVHLAAIQKNEEFKKKYYDLLAGIDMMKEYEFFEELNQKLGSPLLLCHNDFNRGNMIVTNEDETNPDSDKQIYLVDFDYTNFNNRGRDFGRYFSNFRHREPLFGNEGFPTDQEMDIFLEAYRQEMAKIISPSWLDDPKNSIEQLRDEAKIFTMQAYSDDCGFGLAMFMENIESEQFLIIIKTRREGYERLKKLFTDDGTIPRILARKLN